MVRNQSRAGRVSCGHKTRNRNGVVLLGLAAAALVFIRTPGVDAAQTTISISMTAPGAAPRILGPEIIAGKPMAPLLYTVAATGTRPMTFTAAGLPNGLALNAATGTISGTTPVAGSYPIALTVRNGAGSADRTMTLLAGNTLAVTPPMGWNSYDSFGSSVTESEVLAAARAQLAQLQPFGWNHVVVDYLWFDPEQRIDANGRLLPSLTKYPSATGDFGLKPLVDQIHAMGLNFGLHIMRGIPRKTVTTNAPILGAMPAATATAAANTGDACPWNADMWGVNGATAAGQAWYDSIFAQYAAWGVDFIKVDDMINNALVPLVYHQAEVRAIRNAIDKTGRSIVLSLSPGPMQPGDAVSLNSNANMWRMVNDFWDRNGNSVLSDVFTASALWQAVSGLTVGHWPDADMLPLGYLGPRVPSFVHPSGPTAFSHNEQVSVMSLWAILPSPLMFGGNVPMLTTDAATGPWTLALLTNEEVLAINQDVDGGRGRLVAQAGTTQVWAKNLSGGRKAVALFNRGSADAPVSVTWSNLGLTGPVFGRDLWQRIDLGPLADHLTATVPWLGAALILLSPTSPGAADAGADVAEDAASRDGGSDTAPGAGGGSTGSAGAGGGGGGGGGSPIGAGGLTGGGGLESAGGTSDAGGGGTGGAVGAGAVAAAGGSGGARGGGSGGRTTTGATGGGASSGCSCALTREPTDRRGNVMLLMMALGAAALARRRSAPSALRGKSTRRDSPGHACR